MSRGLSEEFSETDGNRIVAAIRRNYAAANNRNSTKSWGKWLSRHAGVIAIGIAVVIVAILIPTGYWTYQLKGKVAGIQNDFQHYHSELEDKFYQFSEKIHPLADEGQAERDTRQLVKVIDEILLKNMGRLEEIMSRHEIAQRSSTTMILERLNEFSQATLSRSHNGAKAVEVLAQLLGSNTEGTNKPTFGEWRLAGRN